MAYVIHPEYYVIIFAALSLPIYFKNEIFREKDEKLFSCNIIASLVRSHSWLLANKHKFQF